MKCTKFFKDGMLLSAVGIAMRTAGIFLASLVSRKIGAVGVGLNSLIMNIYSFALTFSTAGISLAATSLTAAMIGRGERANTPSVLRGAFAYSFIFSSLGTALLAMLSGRVGDAVVGDASAGTCLIILAFSLIPTAISSVVCGYFIGIGRVSHNASIVAAGQALRIVLTVILLSGVNSPNTGDALLALAISVTLTESITAALALIELGIELIRGRYGRGRERTFGAVFRKAFPLAASAYVRSALLTLEHAIIPGRLLLYGEEGTEALASYGYLHGMALPIILYPMVLLSSFSSLLVPEFAEAKAGGREDRLKNIAGRAIGATLAFGGAAFAFLFSFSEELGYIVYNSYDAGYYIALLSPVVPIMYLDHVADNMLKGIGEEVYSMWVNILDALLSLALVFFLLPVFGIAGYALVIIIMEGFNFLLSYIRLRKRVKFSVKLISSFLVPSVAMLAFSLFARSLVRVRGREVTLGILFTESTVALSLFVCFLLLASFFRRARSDKRVEYHHKRNPEEKSVG